MHRIVVQAVTLPLHHSSASPKITSFWHGQCSSLRKQLRDHLKQKGILEEECSSVQKVQGAAL